MEAVGKNVDIPQDQEHCKGEGRTSESSGQVVNEERQEKARLRARVSKHQQRCPGQVWHKEQDYFPRKHVD